MANYRDEKMSFYTIYCSNLISYSVCLAGLPDLVPVAAGRGGADRPDHAAAAAGQSFSQVCSFVFFSRSYTRMAVFLLNIFPQFFHKCGCGYLLFFSKVYLNVVWMLLSFF